ncbi:response regulator [Paenibacillus plantarum]|uniref:response regulator n=1 Tax=Paenibacillus plantarum TaxID=2654975 RepID=UPI001490AC43|nr:response regulator [Paenibacillus plantarum]
MYKLLIVDDEKWVRDSLRNIMKETCMPFTIVNEYDQVKDALDWLSSHQVDLVLIDINMLYRDGGNWIVQLIEEHAECKVVLMSVYSDFEYVRHAERYGVNEYLFKPIEYEELELCLQRFLRKKE